MSIKYILIVALFAMSTGIATTVGRIKNQSTEQEVPGTVEVLYEEIEYEYYPE